MKLFAQFNPLERFLAFKRIPLKIVAVTALASYLLQIGAILQGQPLYVIAFYTLLPWIPLLVFEGLWKYEHYNWIAIFAIVTALQLGHLGEHAFQVTEYVFLNGTLACPPPVDDVANARRAAQAGLRSPTDTPTFISSQVIVKPDDAGAAVRSADGREVGGPPACGVFGQLDFETVHLVWDTLVWITALALLMRFSTNLWLWVAITAASLHEMEHLFLGSIYFFERTPVFDHLAVLWGTTVAGNIVTAHPLGVEQVATTFYEAGGKQGIMGQSGLVEQLIGSTGHFLLRPFLHFGYNSLVVIPTTIAFLMQIRHAYDEYLAKVLPSLTEEQLVATTSKLRELTFPRGATITRQGDPADRFYILTHGEADVIHVSVDGEEKVLSKIGPGQYFGEIGLLQGGQRTATVRASTDVTAMSLDRETFGALMTQSEISRGELERIVRQRLAAGS